MIVEGLVTTQNEQGEWNVAPMGPIVEDNLQRLTFRLFPGSQTYANFLENSVGVFHVTDDAALIACAVLNRLPDDLPTQPATNITGKVLSNACRWYEFEIVNHSQHGERTHFEARVVGSGRIRDFLGFNRAKHAVLEAAILATRVDLIPPEQIAESLSTWKPAIEKTGGPQEQAAFAMIEQYIGEASGTQFS